MSNRFRMVDALAVIAVLAVLTPGLLFVILTSREHARRTTCEYNLKQISLGLLNYSDTFRAFPLGTTGNHALPPAQRFSWYPSVWHFCEGGAPTILVDESQAWNAEVNRYPKGEYYDKLTLKTEIRPLRSMGCLGCPSAGQRPQVWGIPVTHYVGMAGLGENAPALANLFAGSGVWAYDRNIKESDVTDGVSSTISLIETNFDPGPWLAGGPPTVRGIDMTAAPYIGPSRQFGGLHSTCPVAMVDGSVRQLSSETDAKILAAMTTIAGQD